MGDPAGTVLITNEKISTMNGYSSYTVTTNCSESKDTFSKTTYIYFLDGKGKAISFIPFLDLPNNMQSMDELLTTFQLIDNILPIPTCQPRPACLDATPRCMIPEPSDMCPKSVN
jgi:hypothetical protein